MELLILAEMAGFQGFLTLDRGIEHQQNLQPRTIAVIVVRSKSSRLDDLLPFVPECLRLRKAITPGELAKVG
jgi:hypothetical protein